MATFQKKSLPAPPLTARVDGQAVKKQNRLPLANFGERLATDFFAARGHQIVFSKPDLAGTNQGGFDLVTLHNGRVFFIDNKANRRDGLIYSATALGTNFVQNLRVFKQKLNEMMQDPLFNAQSRRVFADTLRAIDAKRFAKIVTNATFVPDGIRVRGVSPALQSKGIQFVNVMP